MSIYVPPRPVKASPIGPGAGILQTEYPLSLMSIGGSNSPQKRMQRAWNLSISVPWIAAAEDVIASRFAGVEWHLEDENDEEVISGNCTPDQQAACDLLEYPQRDPSLGQPYTRTELWSIISRTMGPCGSAFVLMDRMEAYAKTPSILQPIAPWRFTPQEDTQGNLIGWWVDRTATDPGIALRTDEVIHFALKRNYKGHFGIGLIESALLKLENSQGLDSHLGMVISAGGRLSGFLSPEQGVIDPDTMVQMERDWRTVVEQSDAAKRLQLVRAPVKFQATTLTPHELQLQEMITKARDDLLALWGVPFTMIGGASPSGLNSGDARKYDEAALWQGPVHARLTVFQEGLQYQMLDRWAMRGSAIELELEEPSFDDDSPRYDLLGKSLNSPLTNQERRELIGLPPFGDPLLDQAIWMPATIVPSGQAPMEPEPSPTAMTLGREMPMGGPMTPQSAAAGETSEGKADTLDLTQDEIDEDVLDDEDDDWGDEQKAGPKYIFGRLNPAYQASATKQDVAAEMEAIRQRAIKKFGRAPSDAAIRATYQRNLARKQRQGIRSRATRKFGRTPSERAVTNTLQRNIARDARLAALMSGKASQLHPRLAPLHASLVRVRENIAQSVTPRLKNAVHDVLEDQKRDIVARLREHADAVARKPRDTSIWFAKEWDQKLHAALRPHLEVMAATVNAQISDVLPPVPAKAAPPGTVDRVLNRGAAKVTGINETTRDKIKEALIRGLDQGLTANDMADLIEGTGSADIGLDLPSLFDPYRAEMIARTELMDAYNGAALYSYQDAGVQMVTALDGDQDEECASRDGRDFTILEADGIEDHPNGTLDWIPVVNYTALREAFNG